MTPESPRQKAGFTVIELMVVISVIVVLTAMALPTLTHSIHKGRVSEAAGMIRITANEARDLAQANARKTEQMNRMAEGDRLIYFGLLMRRNGVKTDDAGRPLPAHVVLVGWSNPGAGENHTAPVPIGEPRYGNPNVDYFWSEGPQDDQERLLVFDYRTGKPGLWVDGAGFTELDESFSVTVATTDATQSADYTVTVSGDLFARITVFPHVGLIHVR